MRFFFLYNVARFIPHDFRSDENGLTKSEGVGGKKNEESRSPSWWVPTLALSSGPSLVAATPLRENTPREERHSFT